MQEQVSKKPLVDILSGQLNKRIVMSGSDYVDIATNVIVSAVDIATATTEQDSIFLADTQKAFTDAIQKHLDSEAQTFGYTDIVSATSYAGYPNSFQTEALSFGNWRSAVWTYAYAELAKALTGTRAMPTIATFLLELPPRV